MSDPSNTFLLEFIGESINPLYKAFTENILVGLYLLQGGRFRYVNANACAILGYDDPAHLLEKRLWQLVNPRDRKRVRFGQLGKRSAAHPTAPFRMFRQDGAAVWVAMQGVNTIHDGRPANIGYLIDMASIRYLSRALKKYRARLTQVEDAIVEVDLKGNIVSYTPAAYSLWNISGDELVGRNYRSLLDPVSAEIVRNAYRHIYETGVPDSNVVHEFIRNDGRCIVVENSASLIRDHDGKPLGFRMVSRDITEQAETERQTMAQRARLEAVLGSVTDAIITVNPGLRVIEANTAASALCGIDYQAALGDFLPDLQGRCSAACGDVLRRTLQDYQGTKDFRIECRHEQRRRQIVAVNSSGLLDRENNFMGAVLVIRNMTRLQDLESQLRPRHHYNDIIGKSRQMQDIYLLLEDLADLQTTVLVTGESGTGKTLIGKALHHSGPRAHKPFVTVNCSALTESLLDSELFGHAKGAFTGAVHDKQGRFEAAEGGTLLIDEVADMSPSIQLKLLRVLQENQFERVGESVSRKMNVRVIACTNKDLLQKVRCGEFREDLYYRLNVMQMHVPPLRERLEDVPLLIDHFCHLFNRRFNKAIKGVAGDVLHRAMNYRWPGNVRELAHMVEHAFILCDGPTIQKSHLPPDIRRFRITLKKDKSARR